MRTPSTQGLRVLVDIVHPADALFFRRPIQTLKRRGDEVLVLSRKKDIVCELLDEMALNHRPVSDAGVGLIGLAHEMIVRDMAVAREAREFRPHVMVGFGGVAIAHAGRLLGIPAVAFYDSENARLQTRMTWPFISHLYVPESYRGPTPKGRTTTLPGNKSLSFLHPSTFRPNRASALRSGLDPERENFFVRVVSWRAGHDLGKSGWTPHTLRALVRFLAKRGTVHLSSELPVPESLQRFRYAGSIREVHHLVAHCRLYVGESATMASEAALAGTPAIYCGRDFPGYVKELETAGLLKRVEPEPFPRLGSAIDEALAIWTKEDHRRSRDDYARDKPDWGVSVVEALDRYGPWEGRG
jgi:uncharacterized protein